MTQSARDKLKRLADDLAELAERERLINKSGNAPPSIPTATLQWFVAAVSAYLQNKHHSLDQALGLTSPRGRPKAAPEGDKYERARAVWHMREFEEKSWYEIADHFPEVDESTLREELSRYRSDIIAEFARENAPRIRLTDD